MCVQSQSLDGGFLVLHFRNEEYAMPEQQMLSGMGPHLNLATICERYIQEADGALTLFRIVDRFTVNGNTVEMPPAQITFALIVSFRSGEFRGPLDLRLTMESQTVAQAPMPDTSVSVLFEAPEEKSANVIGQVNLKVTEPGLYWIVVRLAGQEYTRIPVRIVYQRQPTVQTGQ